MTHKGQVPILAITEQSLRQVSLPPLVRPQVSVDRPNEELNVWGITYYSYCLVAHMRTVLAGLVQLLEAQNIPAAFIVCRHVFEWTAHACYMSRNIGNYIKKKEWGRAWHLQSLAMEGNIWVKARGHKYAPKEMTEGVPDPLGIANIVACYEEYQRQVGKKSDAKDTYGLLSEHSHPNSACFNRYCQCAGSEVRFISPSKDASVLGEERYLLDFLIFLEHLLKLGKERAVRKHIITVLEDIARLAKDKQK